MTIKEFVDKVFERASALPKSDHHELDILVRIESRLAFNELMDKFNDLADRFGIEQLPADETSLKGMIDLLATRWSLVRLTDANYCHTPDTRANRFYLFVAEEIAKVTGKHKYQYLMPTVDLSAYRTADRGTFENLQLQEFIFSDEGQPRSSGFFTTSNSSARTMTTDEIKGKGVGEPFEVLACLRNAALSAHNQLKTTGRAIKTNLNRAEVERVRFHSPLTTNYYTLVVGGSDVREIDKELTKALASPNYRVSSSYGPEGKVILLNVIMASYGDREGIADILRNVILDDEWPGFLKQVFRVITTNTVTHQFDITNKQIIIHKDNINESVADMSIYQNDSKTNAAILYCFAYIYRIIREKQGDYTSYARGWMYEYNKAEKLAAADVLMAYLVGNHEVGLNDFHDVMPCPSGVTLARRKAALNDGTLGKIVEVVNDKLQLQAPAVTRRCHV